MLLHTKTRAGPGLGVSFVRRVWLRSVQLQLRDRQIPRHRHRLRYIQLWYRPEALSWRFPPLGGNGVHRPGTFGEGRRELYALQTRRFESQRLTALEGPKYLDRLYRRPVIRWPLQKFG